MKKIRRALKHGATIDHVDPNSRMTALLYAVQRDNVDLVQELMSKDNTASPSVPQTRPALLFAAENGSDKVLNFLIHTKNLSLSELDDDRDAISFAARYGRLQTIKLLLAAWEKKSPTDGVRTALKLADERREPALVVAVEAQHEDVIRYLVQQLRGADLTTSYPKALAKATDLRDENALKVLLTYNSDPDTARAQLCRWPLLHNAVARGQGSDTIKFLSNAYRNIVGTVDAFDAEGRTALGLAVQRKDLDPTKLLLRFGADPFAKRLVNSNDLESAFMLAYTAARSHADDFRRLGRWMTPCDILEQDVLDAESYSFHLLALGEDVLEFLVQFAFVAVASLIGPAKHPLLFAVLKAPSATLLKCLLLYSQPWCLTAAYNDFEWTLKWWKEHIRASGTTTRSEEDLRGELTGDLDRQLSRIPAHDLEPCKGRLGHISVWTKKAPGFAEVLAKYSLIIEKE